MGAGDVFNFSADEDVFLFINDTLAIDPGGVHPEASASVNLDAQAAALGIRQDNYYGFDFFFAERHTFGSNFHFETTISCFVPK